MRITLFTLEYPPDIGGVADYYGNLVNSWPNKEEINVFKIKNNKLNFIYWPKVACLLKKYLKKNKSQEVLVGHILPLGAIAYIASLIYPISYSIIIHGLDFSLSVKNRRKGFISNLVYKRAKKIICANSFLANKVEEKYPILAKKIIIVNPGAKVEEVKNSMINNFDDKKIIFSLGRLVPRKGFDKTIEALSILKKEDPDLIKKTIYFLAGAGNDELRLKNLVKKYNLENNLVFLGQISDEEKFTYFNLCDIFCMPSRQIKDDFEGFGIVYLEANLFKKPVIAGRSGGVVEAVEDNLNGLLVNPEDIRDIYLAIKKLLSNQILAKKLGKNGYIRAKEKFNWSKQAKKVRNNLYDLSDNSCL